MTITRSHYQETMAPKLQSDLKITNRMAIPQLSKIVINCGIGSEAIQDKKVIEAMTKQLAHITGQQPVVTKAKKAISSFKLRQGEAIGLKVTLRKKNMYDFLTKLIRIALPRVRDFRGIPTTGFDGHGNYTMGIAEQSIFPELEYTMIDKTRGFEVTFVTTAKTDEEGRALLTMLGLPFEKEVNEHKKK